MMIRTFLVMTVMKTVMVMMVMTTMTVMIVLMMDFDYVQYNLHSPHERLLIMAMTSTLLVMSASYSLDVTAPVAVAVAV